MFLRILCLVLALVVGHMGTARAEGFALNEWSARGVGLAGGLVGRADDVSALAYNAAGLTQLPGTHFMGGLAFIAPLGSIVDSSGLYEQITTTKPSVWMAPHLYASHQLNDNLWLGLGVFSRFGLGNSFDGQWFGRYNVYDVGVQCVSAVPTLAYKINDMFSVSLGVEVMHASVYLDTKIPTMPAPGTLFDNDMQISGQGWGAGAHLGLHMRLNDQWSVGLAYKSQMTVNVNGDANFDRQTANLVPHMPPARDGSMSTIIQLPDSLALGIAYKPLDNLSFEVGTVWTRWSTYNALNFYFDGYESINNKEWRDGWAFNGSVEYKPLDWLALRAGVSRETPVVKTAYADYIMPINGRTSMNLGMGFAWKDLTLDLAYSHVWVDPLDYGDVSSASIVSGHSENVVANVYMFSVGYSF